jgi:Conserved TM helix.
MRDIANTIDSLWSALPAPVAALIVLALGWLASYLLRFVVSKFLQVVRFDKISAKTGFSEFLRKGHVEYSPSNLIGVIFYWLALLMVFLQVAKLLDVGIYNALSESLVKALPNIVAALLIMVVGYLIVSFIANFVLTIALNASVPSARVLSKAIKWLGVVIIATMALEQLGLGRTIVEFIFQVTIAAVVFGIALAFGLGCKDLARDAFKRIVRNLREQDRGARGSDLEG